MARVQTDKVKIQQPKEGYTARVEKFLPRGL